MQTKKHDLPTILAVGALVYVIAKLVHEALGHGLACHFTIDGWMGFSSSFNLCDYEGVETWAFRVTKAAGTAAGLLVGLISLLSLRWIPPRFGASRYFLWLMAAVNLLMSAGYLAVDPIFGFGDWTAFLQGLPGAGIWRWVLAVFGAGLYALFVIVLLRSLRPFLAAPQSPPRSSAWRLCLLPYLVAGGVLLTVAALFNSEGPIYALTSALATLGGTSALAWMPACVPEKVNVAVYVQVKRSLGWIVTGSAAALFCLIILGPGISFA